MTTPSLPAAPAASVLPSDVAVTKPKFTLQPGNEAKLRRTANEFESMFLTQMFELMSKNVQADETFGGGNAENILRSMLNEQYGKQVNKAGGIGVSDAIYREMVRLQEGARA